MKGDWIYYGATDSINRINVKTGSENTLSLEYRSRCGIIGHNYITIGRPRGIDVLTPALTVVSRIKGRDCKYVPEITCLAPAANDDVRCLTTSAMPGEKR